MSQSTKLDQFVTTYQPRPVVWCRRCNKSTDISGQRGLIEPEQFEAVVRTHRCSEAPGTAWDCRS